jgi:hypothetical protein
MSALVWIENFLMFALLHGQELVYLPRGLKSLFMTLSSGKEMFIP